MKLLNNIRKLPKWLMASVPLLAFGFISCSDTLIDEEKLGNSSSDNIESAESIYLSIGFSPLGELGTRTQTGFAGEMDSEDGQSNENSISKVALILTGTDNKVMVVFSTEDNEDSVVESNSGNSYTAYFKKDYNEIKNFLEKANPSTNLINCNAYVVCNYGDITLPSVNNEVQKVVDVSSLSDIDSFGSFSNSFLMSNADYLDSEEDSSKDKYKVTIDAVELRKRNKKENAYPVSASSNAVSAMIVPVQRALARFDIGGSYKANYVYYFDDDCNPLGAGTGWDNSTPPEGSFLKVSIDYLSLANVNTKFNLFKETGLIDESTFGKKENNWGFFWSENSNGRYVIDPIYSGNNGKRSLLYANDENTNIELKKLLISHTSDVLSWCHYSNFQKMIDIFSEDNPSGKDYDNVKYKIWRYCVPNTIHEVEMQKNGITTAVVLAGVLDFDKNLGEGTFYIPANEATGTPERMITPIYYFNGRFYGTNAQLLKAAKEKADIKDMIMAEALEDTRFGTDYITNSSWKDYNYDTWNNKEVNQRYAFYNLYPDALEAKSLTEKGFSIFVPINLEGKFDEATTPNKLLAKDYKYVSLYYYWNRHNDNNDPELMGPMEFDVVRNNIYKLQLMSLSSIGHPAPYINDENTDGFECDPNPIDSYTDDEIPVRYLYLKSQVVKWGKRRDDNIILY